MANQQGARTPVVLIVLDGWGFRPGRDGNAIELGATPVWHRLWSRAPHTLLNASGLAVGLPAGQMGNSEVGHLNLGAGRVVPQDIVRISQAIESGEFFTLPPLVELCARVRHRRGTLHLLGLIGSGGVHALDQHLTAAVRLGQLHELPVAIHAWLDGRDTPPQSGLAFMQELLAGRPVISTVVGRYYAMDRDKRWERTKLAYDAMVHGVGEPASDPLSAIRRAYEHGKTMFRTAETEKYAHVTYFFNGGLETPYPGEERLLVPSQKVATYDLMPEMSAPGVTDVLCKAIEAGHHDFILCNYANGDMVGHSGVLSAAVKAVETVDQCLERVVKSAEQRGATLLVTADHGNCELMIDPSTDGPHTAHTTNPVPFLLIDDEARGPLRHGGALRDVGPTVLRLLDIQPPPEMTGRDLRETN